MFKTQYEHPPRDWHFWGRLIGLMALICSPMLVLFLFSTTFLKLHMVAVLALVGFFLGFAWKILQSVAHLVIKYTDIAVNKEENISEEARSYPDDLEDIMTFLFMEGFTRLGEISFSTGLDPVKYVNWLLIDDTKTILVSAVMCNGKPAALMQTCGKEGLVETMYGCVSKQLDNNYIHSTSFDSDIADALMYHRRQVSKRYMGSDPAVVSSMEDRYANKHSYVIPVFLHNVRMLIRNFTIVRWLMMLYIAFMFVVIADVINSIKVQGGIVTMDVTNPIPPILLGGAVASWLFARYWFNRDVRFVASKKKKAQAYPEGAVHPLADQ